MGQTFINFFQWVDIHGIYYIVKSGTQIWWLFCKKNLYNIPFLTRMTQKWTKNYYKIKITIYIYKRYYQWLCICRKNIIHFKIIYGMSYKGSKLCSHVVFNLTMEWPPRVPSPSPHIFHWEWLPKPSHQNLPWFSSKINHVSSQYYPAKTNTTCFFWVITLKTIYLFNI